jgi:transcriptional regulator with XRE-family HTH domain
MAPVPKPRPKHKTFLRQWRQYRELTQEAGASRIGIDRTTLSKIERGQVPYDQALLERAADAYRCEPADLLMRDPESPIWTLLDAVRKLPEPQQKLVAGIIKGFIESSQEAA